MKINYDKKVDALYIRFQEGSRGEKAKKTFKLKDFFLVDIGAKGRVCGIEILNASMHVPVKEIKKNMAKKTK